jgi:hypothetical protein
MLSEPGFWLIVAGSLLVAASFIGLVFSRASDNVPYRKDEGDPPQPASDDQAKLPAWFSIDKRTFGRAVPKRAGSATAHFSEQRKTRPA